jgi:cytochrome b561
VTTARRYSGVAIALHWLIAAAIIGQVVLGVRMADLPNGLAKFELFQLHKSVGLTILLLSLVRLAWRLTHRPPPYAPGVKGWQRGLATAVHTSFYVLIIAIPLTGWVAVSASPLGIPTLLWDVVPWPHLPMARSEAVAEGVGSAHVWLVRLTVVLLLLHVAGALKHQFLDRDGTLWRMIPLRRVESPA